MRKLLPLCILWILFLTTTAAALQLDPQPGESLLESAQEGTYLALTYKSQEFSAINIRVVDLQTGSIVYQNQEPYPQSNLIHPAIFENYLVYMTRNEIVRVDLTTGQEQIRPGSIQGLTSNGTLVTEDELPGPVVRWPGAVDAGRSLPGPGASAV